jgi:exodeoxyribonuclease V beta subunit
VNASDRDPFLDLELVGLRLIEASAGTGKTFTLATLVTRLVIERGLRVGQILAVTFTDPATQELRERLRNRLALAGRIAAAYSGAAIHRTDADDPAYALTRSLIDSQLQREPIATLCARLQRAACEIDLAAVFTIHAFCTRVLAEHALETGQAFIAPEMIGSDRALRDEIASDLWRSIGTDPLDAELLQAQWPDPQALAADLGALMRAPRLLPPIPQVAPDPLPQLESAFQALRGAFVANGGQARTLLDAAIVRGVIDGRKARTPSYEKAWSALAAGLAANSLSPDADHLDKLTPGRLQECVRSGRERELPDSPLFCALADWFAADLARQQWLASVRIVLLHRIREEAVTRLAKRKRMRHVQTYDDLIDEVAIALDGPHGEALAESLRAQYAAALVDEFQDTDARQWRIFRRIFGEDAIHAPALEHSSRALDCAQANGSHARFLALIGDPKQAIYRFRGGDVHTYLAAAEHAERGPSLSHNFRSRPTVLRAIESLYARAGEMAFVEQGIRFHPVVPGGRVADGDFLRDGRSAPGLTVRVLPSPDADKAWTAPQSRALATSACVEAIHALLRDSRDGHAKIDGHPVQAGDVAVLVRFHHEATLLQEALAAAGIPAVAAGRQSVFGTEQARELQALFEALLRPDDEGRMRAALATILFGFSAEAIARFDDDDAWHREWQLRMLAWLERWERHGPLALVCDVCAANAQRLLGLVDGERRMTNLLQLGEALQEANALALGTRGLVDWLRERIADADENDETQQLRLESDARCVQILTLHKSKGLEFPLVFLPFAGIGRDHQPGRYCEYPDDDGRVLQLKPAINSKNDRQWQDAGEKWKAEERAEDARLLYVGLTRAQHAVWLACGSFYLADATPLAAMTADIASLGATCDIEIDDAGLPATRLEPLPLQMTAEVPPARIVQRVLRRDWWVYSYSLLANDDANAGSAAAVDAAAAIGGERGAEDEPESLPAAIDATQMDASRADPRFAGVRFGNALHLALETVEFARWRDWRADVPPPGEEVALLAALRREGYVDADLVDGARLLCGLIADTLNVQLPEGAQLAALTPDARRVELEFHFAIGSVPVDALLALLHAHGMVLARQGFGLRRRIEGLMTGKIDLVYAYDGRFHVLDYKSNRLADYGDAALSEAIADSEYDLQYLIYSLALHRWLRFRLGAAYDYETHFGGVRYLFCRGLDARRDDSPGIFATKPSRELIDALDAMFATAPLPDHAGSVA